VKFGTTEEWVINNPTGMHHPFHIHVWPFQIVDDGYGKSHEGWHDTISLPSGSTVRIRIPFVDIAGTTVYHCHILDHEDAGMMGIVKVS
jgi:FtsP/CotA-like multicopper oxidase with cupredoxin domain